jgi:hypothetical protein
MQPDDNDEELDEAEPAPVVIEGDERVPEHWMGDDEVASLDVPYSTRAPSDWVISGILGDGEDSRGGRRFYSWAAAELWARTKYGNKFKGRVKAVEDNNCGRWAFLIKRLNGA